MTVVVSDLVAKIRAVGVQETTTALAAAGQEARATGEALDRLAQKFSQTQGGSASGWRDILQRQGLSAADVATQLGTATTNASRLATAAQQVAAPAQAAAQAAAAVHEGFRLSETSALRFGLGVVGIGAGLSLVTKVAEVLHGAIVGMVEAQTEWERGLVRARVLYGDIAGQVVEISKAQAMAPGEAGGQVTRLQANLNAAYLNTRYGLPTQTVFRLTGAAGAASNVLDVNEQEYRDRQARMLAFAEGGGDMLRDIGVEGRPLDIARRLGGVSEQQLQAFTVPQLKDIQTQMGIEAGNRVALEGEGGKPGLLAARQAFEKAKSDAESRLQNYLEGNPIDDDKLRAIITSQAPRNALEAQQREEQLAAIAARAPTQEAQDARAALAANIEAINDHTKALEDARAALTSRGIEVGGAVWRMLGLTGNPEDPLSIARGDVAGQIEAGVASRARSAQPARATSTAEIDALARGRGFAQTYQNLTAPTFQAEQGAAYREYFERIGRPDLITDAERRSQAEGAIGRAQRAGDFASRASEIAQGQITALDLQAQERRLSAAEELARYRGETLTTEGQIVPLLLRQADLQDRMVVASRDNLNTTRAMISAQQAALPSQFGLADLDFGQKMLQARADASRAAFLRGGQTTEDIGDLRRQYYELDIQRAEQTPEALQRQRDVELVGRTATQEGLGRALRLTDLEQERRALEDQTIPLNQHLRITQAEEASIARRLELRDLDDTKARTAAQFALTAADGLQLLARTAAGAAADYAAGLNLGASASEQIKGNLQAGYQAMNDTALALSQVQSLVGPPASGGSGGSSTLVIHINGSDRSSIHSEIDAALDRFLSGANTSGPPAPAGVAGAGR